jgi:hypothetical protein
MWHVTCKFPYPTSSQILRTSEEVRVGQYLHNNSFRFQPRGAIITVQELKRLKDGRWLNDEILNGYLSMIMERSLRWNRLWDVVRPSSVGITKSSMQLGNAPWAFPDYCRWRIHCFTTYFWKVLQERGYEAETLGRWTRFVRGQPCIPGHIWSNFTGYADRHFRP